MSIKSRIRTIPGYPKAGIQFRDITTLLQDPVGLRLAVELGGPATEQVRAELAAIEAALLDGQGDRVRLRHGAGP